MKKLIYLICFSCLLFGCKAKWAATHPVEDDTYVVVLSLDAFRSDYQDLVDTPTLDSLTRIGVKSGFTPCFPSLTFPNHYSMATGLHPNNHGLVHNRFLTDGFGTYVTGNRSDVENPVFYLGEPIWVTAHKQGLKTASYFWVGTETAIQGMQPDIWKRFDAKVSFQSRADSVIAWLSLPRKERPRLIMWYIEEPDGTSHHHTPNGKETVQLIQDLDNLVGDFCQKMNKLPIADKINFILVSDHGMVAYNPERYINLADYMPLDSFRYVTEGATTLLYPKDGYTETAYNILKTIPYLQVWQKNDVPEKYHYGSNNRIGDLVVLADMGVNLEFRDKSLKSPLKAAHGFDNFAPEMEGIFYGSGPDFKQGEVVAPMLNLNLYLLICRLLNLTPAPNEGDDKVINRLLK